MTIMSIVSATFLLVAENREDTISFFSECLGLEMVENTESMNNSQLRFRLHEQVDIAVIIDPKISKTANAADLPTLSLSFSDSDFKLLVAAIRTKLPCQDIITYDTPFAEIIDLPNLSGLRIQIRST